MDITSVNNAIQYYWYKLLSNNKLSGLYLLQIVKTPRTQCNIIYPTSILLNYAYFKYILKLCYS